MKPKIFFFTRMLLGVIFLVFGLNGFFNFIPPSPMPQPAMMFAAGIFSAPYFLPFLKFTEVLCAVALLSGYFVPLALVILAPVTLNIFMFHLFLAPGGLVLALPILALHLATACAFWPMYAPFFNTKRTPACAGTTHGHTFKTAKV